MIQQMLAIWYLVSLPFSKLSLCICKSLVHVLLKPSLKEYSILLARIWNEHNCLVVWQLHEMSTTFFGIGMKTDIFQSYSYCLVFQICWHIECNTLTASYFRIWNSTPRIPSAPLSLFLVMLPKTHLTSHSRMSGSRWVTTPSWLSWSLILFCVALLCSLGTSS